MITKKWIFFPLLLSVLLFCLHCNKMIHSAAYSHVVENTAFFGDVALRFPRIVHHYYDRNSDWGGLLRWGLDFCNLTGVFTGGAHQHVLTLVSPDCVDPTSVVQFFLQKLNFSRRALRPFQSLK